MGRSAYTLQDAQRDLAAGQQAFEARNAQIDDWSAREKERIEREFEAKKAALIAAQKREVEAAGTARDGRNRAPGPGQVMPVSQAAPGPPPAQMIMPHGSAQPVPVYYVPAQGQVQVPIQQQLQIPVTGQPAPAQPRIRKPPAETMRDIRLLAICKRRADNGARTQRINQAAKAGAPATQEPPLPDEDWYLAEEIKRAIERGDITWKEIKKVEREEEGGCCVLM
ncbi:hypothetical protein V8F20_003201 [Naviculisporaceae sp. PSN 640]